MEAKFCIYCSIQATHRCTTCNPNHLFCRDCISNHIKKFPEDSIIPIRHPPVQNHHIFCEICTKKPAKHLQVLTTQSIPLCKDCKRGLVNADDSLFTNIKWKDVVSNTADIPEISKRTHISRQAKISIDQNYLNNSFEESIVEMKNTIITSATKYAEKKIEEAKAVKSTLEKEAAVLKKEVESQIVKKKPDMNTLAGKMVDSYIKTGEFCPLPSNLYPRIEPIEIDDLIQTIFDKTVVQTKRSKYNVYLFHPGKLLLTKIDVETMTKQEFSFEKTWNFEASWCELASGDIFFCGGNGLNSAEVLIVDIASKHIKNGQNFTGRAGHAILEISGHVFVFGGNKGPCAEKYSFNDDQWVELAQLPQRISRISICSVVSGIFIVGIECSNIYLYDVVDNKYTDAGNQLENYKTKNKLVFSHEHKLYCLCGDRGFVADTHLNSHWQSFNITDRDWWSYSKPVIYNNCAYFIKYFVRNLWKLDLETFEMTEFLLQDIQMA